MIGSLIDISNFSLLLFLFLYIFALLGMELFAYKVYINEDGDPVFGTENIRSETLETEQVNWPRENFNDI